MAADLGLTSDQQTKLEPIITGRDKQIEDAQADTSLSMKEKRKKVRSIRMDADTQIEAMLTDAQKTQYEQMKQTHKGGKRGNAPAAAPAAPQPPQ